MDNRLQVAILWHMHQPCYLDPVDPGRPSFVLPWVRLHALKDYWGMARLLDEFPGITATFNLVPALLEQLELYVGGATDLFQELAAKPAVDLEPEEKEFLLCRFFSANLEHQIKPYPRYYQLYQKREEYLRHPPENGQNNHFSTGELRDLQIWHTLSYFDPLFRQGDERVSELIRRQGHYQEEDKTLLQGAERDLLSRIIPEYRRLFQSGRIEICTSPYYHPIMPLLLDPSQGRVANPSLPPYGLAFHWREDTVGQVRAALEYTERLFGGKIKGMWPSEGSLSQEAVEVLDEAGLEWTAADEGNLARSLGVPAERDCGQRLLRPELFYRPYRLGERPIRIFFRDHLLSDLIGFFYQKFPAEEAAADLVRRLEEIQLPGGESGVVPIILDGENAWEYYPADGRDFLRSLYGRLSSSKRLRTVTFSQALAAQAGTLSGYAPGSWINANFDIWIGDDEDRRAWELVKEARDAFGVSQSRLTPEQAQAARRLLWIAQGSDWYWWFGRENYTPDLETFDLLFRRNLQEVYRLLGLPVPDKLLAMIAAPASDLPRLLEPQSMLSPSIDGQVSDYFEWEDSGRVLPSRAGGSMHMAQPITKELRYGFDARHLFLRIDTVRSPDEYLDSGFDLDLFLAGSGEPRTFSVTDKKRKPPKSTSVRLAVGRVIEVAVPLSWLGAQTGERLKLQLTWHLHGTPFQSFPAHAPLELPIPDPRYYLAQWQV